MLENILFGMLMAFVSVGLILTCASLLQMYRKGGFESAMALTPEGKWPLGRYLFYGALACFVVALSISIFD